jgi:hypothetical protein
MICKLPCYREMDSVYEMCVVPHDNMINNYNLLSGRQ